MDDQDSSTFTNEFSVETNYLNVKDIYFDKTKGGFLSLKLSNGEFYNRVNLYRAFPLSKPDEFISVRDVDDEEIGIIRYLDDVDNPTRELINIELDRRYFSPVVEEILSLKDEYGHVYMTIITNSGQREITVPMGSSNIIKLKNNRIILLDIDGNRYDIVDYKKLDSKSIKLLESVI